MSDQTPRIDATLSGPLGLIAELNTEFAASLDIEATLNRAVERISAYVGAEGGALFLLENDDAELVCRACVGPVKLTGLRLGATEGIVGRCVQSDETQRVRDVSKDAGFKASVDEESGFTTRSILCAPMRVQDQRLGAIELVNKQGGDGLFGEEDGALLEALAASAALAVLNARMAHSLVEKERIQRELDLAAEIQRNMLPTPEPAPFPITGMNLPARGVSGDFYDFFRLPDGSIYFCIGDVSGKGMNAALLMAKTSSLMRCLGKTIHRPGRLLGILNDEILETVTRGMFVAMIVGVLDPASGRVTFANAGHEPALWRSATGSYKLYPGSDPPLGILPTPNADGTYPETDLELGGGTLYLYTDGVTEGYAHDGQALGLEGIQHALDAAAELPATERLRAVADKLSPGSLRDDFTFLAIEPQKGGNT